jgi:hypothetical protein
MRLKPGVTRATIGLMSEKTTNAVLEPAKDWPEGYVESFIGVPQDFERPAQGTPEQLGKQTPPSTRSREDVTIV